MTNRKIIHQVTRRYMAQTPRRTVVSLLGIALMVTLMTCVFVGKDTALGYLTDVSEASYGKWHYAVSGIDRAHLENLRQLPFVRDTALSENQQYTLFPQSGRADHPYLNLRRYSDNAFDWMNIQLTQGRLPEREGEVILSNAALADGAQVAIGDQITVEAFRRYLENFGQGDTFFPFLQFELNRGETKEAPANFGYFPPGDPFYEGHREIHQPTGFSQTYTVVGFIQPPTYENAGSAAYTALAWLDEASLAGDFFDCSLITDSSGRPMDAIDTYDLILAAAGTEEVQSNDPVLSFSASSSDSTINSLVIMAQVFFTLLILLVSVVLIYNMFNLSYDQRCRYLGMLSSVGATGRQKRSSVYYEAAVLLLPALPVGFLLGLAVVHGGVGLLAPLVGNLMGGTLPFASVPVHLVLRPLSVLLALGVSGATVLFSALLPARRISKIGPVESIRGTPSGGKAGHRLRPRLLAAFGGEGMLARGFLLHQKKKTRGILRALAAFLIILMVTVYGGEALCQMVSYKLEDSLTLDIKDPGHHNYNLVMDTHTFAGDALLEDLAETPGITDLQTIGYGMWTGNVPKETYSQEYWDRFREICSLYFPEGISQEELQNRYIDDIPRQICLVSVEEDTFQAMLSAVGGDVSLAQGDACILLGTGELSTANLGFEGRDAAEYRFYEIEHMTDLTLGQTLPITIPSPNDETDALPLPLTLAGFGDNDSLSPWLAIHDNNLWAITKAGTTQKILDHFGPENCHFDFHVFFQADETVPQAQAKLQQMSVMEGLYFSSTSVDTTHSLSATLSTTIRVLIFAFILISSLLCYLNLYNAISGLMIARRKDFAILRSAGMTLGQIGKLCRYELCFLLLESLLLAAPVTALLCWGISTVLVGRFGHFTVAFPALPLAVVGLLSLLVVFIMEKICCAREARGDLLQEIKRDSM